MSRTMKVVIAPDKFKGALSAPDVARAMARGVRRASSRAVIDEVPMADGGEGTVDALIAATGGRERFTDVAGPLGDPVRARWGILGDGSTAVLEMAAASGLVLVPAQQRDPRRASTRGTGELLLAALDAGVSRVILGIGGSATNDGGAGLAQALGYRLLDANGDELPPGGAALARLDRIDAERVDPRVREVVVEVACDVDNPLCGPRGASAIYGPQKGANPEMVLELDAALARFASVAARDLGRDVADLPGAGAAGGLGAGLVAFAGGRLSRGAGLVIDAVGLERRLAGAAVCFTGEGAIDGSSLFGKTAIAVARLARTWDCAVVALVGSIGPGAEAALDEGVTAVLPIAPGPSSLEDAITRTAADLERAAEQAMRLFVAGSDHRDDA
ncbi:MAG: glycerate kinase [Isosphaeraceae bacterium]|nr:glycerate kinase [Isosphaeraceae bacterium]